jgi:Holliday junction DNA helicase RuvB
MSTKPIVIPDNIFDDIVGHNNVKDLIKTALNRYIADNKNYAFLLVGPPASAKTMFLDDFIKLPLSRYIVAVSTTKVGLRDILLYETPRFLAIDEIDKASPEDFAMLLTLIDKGIVQKNVAGTSIEKRINCVILMAANNIHRIPNTLISRSIVIEFQPYSKQELMEIGRHILKREGVKNELIDFIVEKGIQAGINDPRDFIKIAKLASNEEEVLKVLNTMKIGGKKNQRAIHLPTSICKQYIRKDLA